MVTNEAKIGMKEEKEYELNSLLKVQTNPKVNHYMGHSKYNFERFLVSVANFAYLIHGQTIGQF